MDPIEIEAKTVDEAISIACEQLKTPQENLTIEVLQDAPSKIFAFMSNRKAKIRATPISEAQGRSSAKPEISADIESRLKETLETIVNCLSVLQFAFDTLRIGHIIVCGHYGCGGVHAALDANVTPPLREWLAPIRATAHAHARELAALDPQMRPHPV